MSKNAIKLSDYRVDLLTSQQQQIIMRYLQSPNLFRKFYDRFVTLNDDYRYGRIIDIRNRKVVDEGSRFKIVSGYDNPNGGHNDPNKSV